MSEDQMGIIWFCHWRSREEWQRLSKQEQLAFIEVENRVLNCGAQTGGRRFGPYDTRWSTPWFGYELWLFPNLEGVERLVRDFAEIGGYKYSQQSNFVARQFCGPLGASPDAVGRAPYGLVMGLQPRSSFYHQFSFAQQQEEELATAGRLVELGGTGVHLICAGRSEFSAREERLFFLEYPGIERVQEHMTKLEDETFYRHWSASLMSVGKLMEG